MKTFDGRGPGNFLIKAFFVGIAVLLVLAYLGGRFGL